MCTYICARTHTQARTQTTHDATSGRNKGALLHMYGCFIRTDASYVRMLHTYGCYTYGCFICTGASYVRLHMYGCFICTNASCCICTDASYVPLPLAFRDSFMLHMYGCFIRTDASYVRMLRTYGCFICTDTYRVEPTCDPHSYIPNSYNIHVLIT